MDFESMKLREELRIEKVYTIHYFAYMKDFSFPGESHDFWEFQCVDKGEIKVCGHTLKAGQIIFHKPNELHDLSAAGSTAPNVVVVSFECSSPAMRFFEGKILEITQQERNLLGKMISEARRCIQSPLDDPYLKKMERREDAYFGSEQFIRIYLESLLLHMIRRHLPKPVQIPIQMWNMAEGAGMAAENHNKVVAYLEEHICGSVTIEDICRDNLIGKSQLQKLFRDQNGCGVIDFFSRMKVEYAKQLIREQNQNFTQIAEFLGYSSIHYFSRQFKKVTGMTPSEYMASIKAVSEQKSDQ